MRVETRTPSTGNTGPGSIPIVAVVGATRNSREHLLATRMADCLANQGLRVAVTRLTGTHRTIVRDSCHWISTRDLADYGYVSTRTCDPRELSRLFAVQMSDIGTYAPDVIVVELEGTLWRQDVRTMLSIIGKCSSATAVVSASDPAAALLAQQMVTNAGLTVAALWTPLADASTLRRDRRIRAIDIPVCGRGDARCAARAITTQLRRGWVPLSNSLFDARPQAAAA